MDCLCPLQPLILHEYMSESIRSKSKKTPPSPLQSPKKTKKAKIPIVECAVETKTQNSAESQWEVRDGNPQDACDADVIYRATKKRKNQESPKKNPILRTPVVAPVVIEFDTQSVSTLPASPIEFVVPIRNSSPPKKKFKARINKEETQAEKFQILFDMAESQQTNSFSLTL